VVFAELGDEAILLHAETGVYFGLDAVGTRIWALLNQCLDDDAIVSRLVDEFAVDPTVLRRDVDRFLGQLQEHGLISRSAAASA
jgi:hypothetical protein